MLAQRSGMWLGEKGSGPPRLVPVRARPVQLRFTSGLTSEEYVRQEAWKNATLDRCPAHPRGGCRFARHTAYPRVGGILVARYYCRTAHQTFSLLPDFLASRLSSDLGEVEMAVVRAEASATRETAAKKVRPDIETPGGLRWTFRRVDLVHAALTSTVGLLPDRFAGCEPTIASFRERLGVERVLVELRAVAAAHLHGLPPPLGFGPRPVRRRHGADRRQHETGPDPPRPRA